MWCRSRRKAARKVGNRRQGESYTRSNHLGREVPPAVRQLPNKRVEPTKPAIPMNEALRRPVTSWHAATSSSAGCAAHPQVVSLS